jgi:hypothetical protein
LRIKAKYLFLFLSILFFAVGFLFIEYDLPSSISSSRAPWIDEALKNHITKNIVEFGTPQPYADNEFRASWKKVPLYTLWTLPFAWIFGAGYTQIRILSLLTALIAAGFIYLLLRKDLTNHQMNIFLILLFSNLTFFAYSRMGTYESLFLLLASVIFFLVYHYSESVLFIILAGFLCTIIYWLKATGITVTAVVAVFLFISGWAYKNKLGEKTYLKNTGIFALSFIFFMGLLKVILKYFFHEGPRSLSISGAGDILGGKTVSGLYAFLWHFFTMFEAPVFVQLNLFLTVLALMGLGFFIMKLNNTTNHPSKLSILMAIWMILWFISIGWSTYTVGRLYYGVLPPLVYWTQYAITCKKENLFPQRFKMNVKFLTGYFFLALSFSLLVRFLLIQLNGIYFCNQFIARVFTSPYKIVLIWLLLVTFSSFFVSQVRKYKNVFIRILNIILFTVFMQNGYLFFSWWQTRAASIVDSNRVVKQILEKNGENKVAGQWSSAFVFDLNGVESYPIIPGVYNDDIISKKDIRYVFLERGAYEIPHKIMADNPDKFEKARIIQTFLIGDKWFIDLYDTNS